MTGGRGGLQNDDIINKGSFLEQYPKKITQSTQHFRFEIIVFILVAITIKIMNWGGGVSQHLRFKLCLELSSKRAPYCLCYGEKNIP